MLQVWTTQHIASGFKRLITGVVVLNWPFCQGMQEFVIDCACCPERQGRAGLFIHLSVHALSNKCHACQHPLNQIQKSYSDAVGTIPVSSVPAHVLYVNAPLIPIICIMHSLSSSDQIEKS